MIRKGDCVVFLYGKDWRVYEAVSDTYFKEGKEVIDLSCKKKEIDIERLAKIDDLFKEDF